MGIRLGELIECQETLAVLNQQRGFNSITAYRIMKNVKAIDVELKDYNEQRIKLCEEYANKDDEGKAIIGKDGNYDISDENMKKYVEELEKLHKEIIEVPIKKIPLKAIDCAGLAPAQIETIEFMLEIDNE